MSKAGVCSALVTLALAMPGSSAQAQCLAHSPRPADAPARAVYQQFPADGEPQTAWLVTYGHEPQQGFFITSAFFNPARGNRWIQVLGRAGLADVLVTYARGQPRFLDVSTVSLDLLQVGPNDAGRCGHVLEDRVVREVRDRGMLWKDYQRGRRAEELLLWGTLAAGNYSYLVEYAFRDDGSISFRAAATGTNLPGGEAEAHIHNVMWRIDVDLNGPSHNTIHVLRHAEAPDGLTSRQVVEPFNGGKEGWLDWNPHEFSSLLVTDASLRNERGAPTGYVLIPSRTGSAHPAEGFAQHDFWVTQAKPEELFFRELERYVSDEAVVDTDVVIWHTSPILHVPRDEDGHVQGAFWRGAALATWAGFELRPRNLFDTTPFYP